MKKYFILSLLCLFATEYMWAQPTTNRIPREKMMEIGDERFDAKDTYTALEWYVKAHEADPKDTYAIFKVANTHHKLRDYPQASEWYGKLAEADAAGDYPLARYQYANALKMTGNYDAAITEFQKFAAAYTSDDADYYKKRAEIEIKGAQLAKEWGENPEEELVVENLGEMVNSSSSEGGAYPMGRETIIYSSLKADTLIEIEDGEEGKFAKIYTTTKEEGGEWAEAQIFNEEALSKKGFHVVQPAFSMDLTKFYFVRAQLTGNILENSRIYYAAYNDGSIGEPSQLDFNSNKYACKNPSIAKWGEKEYLLFSSNMPGGEGGFDLWYAEINEDGSTKQPLNFGATVNTIADDITPFFDERDNNLYFASEGHPGMGGFDIFRIQRNPDTEEWTQVENMKPGFNSYVDDFGFIINKEGRDDCYAYVTSNRPGTMTMGNKSETCCDDIFSVLMPERCDIIYDLAVYDKDSNEPLNGATVQLIDKATGEVVDEQTNTEGNEYTFILEMNKDYEVVAKKEGLEAGKTEATTNKEELVAKGFDITRPIEFSDQVSLEQLGLMVETYNKKTGEPLTGATVVIYDAASGDVVKELTETGGNRFTFNVPRTKSYKIAARAEKFIGDNKTVDKGDLGTLQKLYLTPPPLFVNIYFNFDKYAIRTGAADTLDQVLAVLKDYPELVVEVRGHTDAKGSNIYNDKLSKQRSDATIKYLIDKGIDKSRLIPKGLGEEQPAAPNTNPEGGDNPQGRQLNRRVEFKIIEGTIGVTESGEPVNVVNNDSKKKQ